MTSIEQAAFLNNNLTSLVLSENLTTISEEAFASNELTTVTIPTSVTSIEQEAFNNNLLTNIEIPTNVTTIGDAAFANNQLTEVLFSESISTIGANVFNHNLLTEIRFPENVATIGARAFGNNLLTDVYSESLVPPTITTGGTFDTFGDRSNTDLHIPIGTTGVYVTDPSALWTDFNSVTEDAILSTTTLALAEEVIIINSSEILEIITKGASKLNNYKVYSISGALLKTGSKNTIAISDIANGVYVLELTFNTGTLIKKFAK